MLIVGAALTVGGGPVTGQTPRRIIDAHVHVTLSTFPAVLAAFRQHGVVLAVASGRRKEDVSELQCSSSGQRVVPIARLVARGFEDRLMFGTDVAADTGIIARSIDSASMRDCCSGCHSSSSPKAWRTVP